MSLIVYDHRTHVVLSLQEFCLQISPVYNFSGDHSDDAQGAYFGKTQVSKQGSPLTFVPGSHARRNNIFIR